MGNLLDNHFEDILKNEPTIVDIIRKEMEEELKKDKHCFRIIAVRVLAACAPRIRRALKEETTYFLCNDYKDQYDETGKWKSIVKTVEDGRLPMDFFAVPGQTKRLYSPSVSISAIVGKNGDGKSSLVEVMLRIINNFGVAFGFKEDQESLTSIEELEAVLFYEIDEKLYYIKCTEGKVHVSFSKTAGKEILKKYEEALFYNIVANYSIYAYNSRHFKQDNVDDEDCWINGVFHKNDSYQTPLVLNPMRTEGNFDVNREENLCRQRLMSIYADLGNDPDARVINKRKIATGFAFNLEDKSKLETTTLRRYFQKTWKSTNLNTFSEKLKKQIEVFKTSKRMRSEELVFLEYQNQVDFWTKYAELWKKYEGLFKLANQVLKQIYIENQADYNVDTSDLKRYLKVAKEAFIILVGDRVKRQKAIRSMKWMEGECGMLTGLQLQRLVLIIDVCEKWTAHEWFKNKDFSSAISQYVNGKGGKSIGKRQAFLYVIYKTINIFTQYKRFQELLDLERRDFYLFDKQLEVGLEYDTQLSQCFNLLFEDKKQMHIEKKYDTLKLRQTINYLIYKSFKPSETEKVHKERCFEYGNYVSFNKLQGFILDAKTRCDEETIALLPPPIFVGDILIREDENRQGNALFKMADLSSGELQMLYSISTYIYHLRNLNYHVGSSTFVEYKYVNLVLEEVELYFHPEYQRQYIYNMLRQIEQARLYNIKAINVILVTHSPFVLTDIPKNNVLFLQEGEPVHVMQENTFGANIHSLLQNGFFLEGAPMGEFAKEKINKMFERLHQNEYGENLFEEIKLVSEPLLKTQLYQLYSLNKLPNQHSQFDELLERIKVLEDKLNG